MTAGSKKGWAALVEREGEREVMELALASSRLGRGRVVLLYGQGGSGRSSLLRASKLAAEARGILALEACGSELERGYAFGIVRQLLEARIAGLTSNEQQSLLAHAGPAAESALGIGPSNPRASSAGFDQIESTYRLVVRLATDAPLLVAVDDLQWCDRPSLDFLSFLGHRVGHLPVTIIAAWRRGEPGVRAGRLQALAGMPQTFFLTPAPLSHEGVRAVLKRETGTDPSDEAVGAVHTQTGGRPYLVTELVASLRLRGVPVESDCREAIGTITPESVRRNVVARLGRHPETVQRLARAAALLGDASVRQVAAVAEVDRDEARSGTGALVRAGLFRDDSTVAYADPILQRAVYSTLSSLERADLHLHAAALLCGEASGADPAAFERAARHLLNCEPAGDSRFGEALCAAALRAAEEGALADAQQFYERALGEIEDATARSGVLVQLAEIELHSGNLESGAAHASEALTLASTPSQRASASLACARALEAGSDWRTAADLLETEALTFGGRHPDLALHLRAAASTLRACEGPDAVSDEAIAFEDLPGETIAERAMLAVCASQMTVNGAAAAEQVAEICSRALSAEATSRPGEIAGAYLACHAAVLADAGDLVEAVLARRRSEQSETSTESFAIFDAGLTAQLALARGRLADAYVATQEGLRLLEDLSPSPLHRRVRADVLATQVLVEIERGRNAEAAQALAQLSGRDSGNDPPAVHCLRIALALAQSVPAVDLAIEAERQPVGVVAPASCLKPWAALAHHAAGDRSRSLALATDHLEFARAWGGPTVLGRALLVRGVVGSGAERLRFLEEAVAVLEKSPARLELARAAVELGAGLRRARRLLEARAQLVRGGDLAQRCGADALATRAHAELVLAGARPRRAAFSGISSLTVAELRVAMLAAAGMTTREIAKELIVSAKTVSGQLSAVYLKLDVHDRAALAAAMQVDQANVDRDREPVH